MKMFQESCIKGLLEDKSVGSRPGVLRVLSGPFMEYGAKNENNRVYSKRLVENRILGDTSVRDLMQNFSFLGEGCHPKERASVEYPSVTHNVVKMWLDEEKGLLMGTLEILDTPGGRVMDTLAKYGCKIGISARAAGESKIVKGVEYIDEDTYQIYAFDLVPQPGFYKARLTEGRTHDPKSLIMESIQDIVSSVEGKTKDVDIDKDRTGLTPIGEAKVTSIEGKSSFKNPDGGAKTMDKGAALQLTLEEKTNSLKAQTTLYQESLEVRDNLRKRNQQLEAKVKSLEAKLALRESLFRKLVSEFKETKTKLEEKLESVLRKMVTESQKPQKVESQKTSPLHEARVEQPRAMRLVTEGVSRDGSNPADRVARLVQRTRQYQP